MMATKKRLLGLTLLLAAGMSLAGCMGDDTESTPDEGVGGNGAGGGATNGTTDGTTDGTTNDTADGNATGGTLPPIAEGEAPQAPPTFPPESAGDPDVNQSS